MEPVPTTSSPSIWPRWTSHTRLVGSATWTTSRRRTRWSGDLDSDTAHRHV